MPAIDEPVSPEAGYPPAAITSVTAASSTTGSSTCLASPAAAAASASRKLPSRRGSSDCVSGSPKRQLNSSTRGPFSGSITPANSAPRNGESRRASSARTGLWIVSTSSLTSTPGAGEYEPIPPVFGPTSPSKARLKSCTAGSGTAFTPSESAHTDTSGPSSSSSITSGWPSAAAVGSAASSSSCVRHTKTPFPAASPSALITHGGRATGSSAAVGTPAALMTSLAKPFEPSIAAAERLGPKIATPFLRRASATPSTSGASGPTTTRSTASSRASPSSPSASSARTGWQSPRRAIPGLPGAQWSSVSAVLCAIFHASASSRPPYPTRSTFARRVSALRSSAHALALGSGSDQAHRHLELALDDLDVRLRCDRQAVVERLRPTLERLVDRAAVMEVGLVRGKVRRLRSVRQQIPQADGNLCECGEHVELRERERREAVQPHGVAKRDEVEPAAPALPTGDRAELAAELAELLLLRGLDLARERPLADARDVRFCVADDLVETVRADA